MPAILKAPPQNPAPIEVLKQAIAEAREHDIPVRATGPHGVVCTSTHGPVRWELDPDRREDVEDGLELAPKDPAWMASGRRALYEHGRESGVLLRLHVASFPSGGGRP